MLRSPRFDALITTLSTFVGGAPSPAHMAALAEVHAKGSAEQQRQAHQIVCAAILGPESQSADGGACFALPDLSAALDVTGDWPVPDPYDLQTLAWD